MENKVVMIIGMHRSGTSLVSQWLYKCGLSLGHKFIKADIGNTDGHFEDEDFVNLHTQLLKKRKLSRWGLVQSRIVRFDHTEEALLQNLVEQKNSNNCQWGWKDPRTCLFLPIYKKLLPEAFHLVIVRGFNESVNSLILRDYKMQEERYQRKRGLSKLKWTLFSRKSLMKHFEKNAGRYLATWICYHEEILNHVQTAPASKQVFVNYKDLLTHDFSYCCFFRNAWNIELEHVPFDTIFKNSLLSNVYDISIHITNKILLQRAIELDNHFQKLANSSLAKIVEMRV